MADLVTELNSLNLYTLISGPLQAAVEAQEASSLATVDFIEKVGFTLDTNTGGTVLRYVDFAYSKSVPNPNFNSTDTTLPANTNTTDQFLSTNVTIKVPFLTAIQIPSIRIEDVTIDFNARLTSAETSSVSSEASRSSELGINLKVINLKASAAFKRTTFRGEKVEKSYNMNVRVHAVGDDIPEGLSRVLNLLEDSIVSA